MYVVWCFDNIASTNEWKPVAEFKDKEDAKRYVDILEQIEDLSSQASRNPDYFYSFGMCEKGKPFYMYYDKDHDEEEYPECCDFYAYTMSCTKEDCIEYGQLMDDEMILEKPAMEIKDEDWCPGTDIFEQCGHCEDYYISDDAEELTRLYEEMENLENGIKKKPESKRSKKQKKDL